MSILCRPILLLLVTLEHAQSEDNHVLGQMADFVHLGLLLF